jgi:hypothetical protein
LLGSRFASRASAATAAFLAIGLFAPACEATLGEPLASVARDATKLKAPRLAAAAAAPAPGGGTMAGQANDRHVIHQYADASGQVYAIAWKGFGHPDLSVILGSYYSEYAAGRASGATVKLGRSSQTKTKNIVVRLSGIPTRMAGIAYLPSRLPAGVNPEQLR